MTKLVPAPADSVGSVSSSRFGNYSATILALTTTAVSGQAAIVYYNPDDVTFGVLGGSTVDFKNGIFGGTGLLVNYPIEDQVDLYARTGGANATATDGGADGQLTRFEIGDPIGVGGGGAGWKTLGNYANNLDQIGYPWNPPSGSITGYVGVRLDDIGNGPEEFYYGWLRMTYNKDAQTVTLHDFAYESTQNVAIQAGAVPEPAETGLLAALGAGGLATWRKLRQKRRSTAA